MVRITSLTRISNYIEENNLKEMIPWSTRAQAGVPREDRNDSFRTLISNIRKILTLVSGNEIVPMLTGNFIIIFFII